jgi:predicted nucleic acid-binding protein
MARSRRRTQAPPPQRLMLDSGAVIALSRNDPRARAALAAAWEAGADVSIPSIVLAETIRGSATDAPVNRVVKAVGDVTPVDEAIGRLAGGLLSSTRSDSTNDAVVAAAAVHAGGAVILTGDTDDLGALASGHAQVIIQAL